MRRSLRFLAALGVILAAPLTVGPAGSQNAAPPGGFKIIGYYPDWTAGRYPLAEIPAAKLTHVQYAFARVGKDSRLEIIRPDAAVNQVYPGDCAEPGCKHGLFNQVTLLKQKHPHLRFLLSVGGWADSEGFYEMAATENGRRTFAASCAEFLKTYPQFDGVDMDWEHPVVGGQERALGQPRDARNYVLLLEEIRRAIGSGGLLSIAIGAGPNVIEPLDWPSMAATLDWVAVMTYDFHTGGPTTGYNAPLYDSADPHTPRHNTDAAVQTLLAKGVPPSKLAVGIPFYSRGWRGVDTPGAWQTGTGTFQSGPYRSVATSFINAPGWVRSWDDVAKVPSLYNAQTREWISYDDPQSIRLKGEYIASRGLAGGMFWELSNDNGELLNALRDGLGLTAR
jgi:chitinase